MLTDDEIDAMPAGRELDVLIAEHVMGLEPWLGKPGAFHAPIVLPHDTPKPCLPPAYSTDIAAAFSVLMAFPKTHKGIFHTQRRSNGWTLGQPLEWQCTIGATNKVSADTAPLAICRAALKAVIHAD